MFTISEASEKDIPAIQEIADRTWWPTYSTFLSRDQIRYMLSTIYSTETMKKDMATAAQTFLLLTDESGVKAFASYGKRPEDPAVSKLHKLYVLPSVQEKGYLNVNRFNPARGFYERSGFKILREEDIPIGEYWMNDFVMRIEF
jgi:hypothetical protein